MKEECCEWITKTT